MKLIDREYALRTFIDNEIRLEKVYTNGDWDGTFEHGVNCGLENACKLLDECPTVNPLQEVLEKLKTMDFIASSEREEFIATFHIERCIGIVEEVMKKYE